MTLWPFSMLERTPNWSFPLFPEDLTNHQELTSKYGVFGYKRSYYFHKGIDLYVKGNAPVTTAEAGTVVAIIDFTGSPDEPHWLYTQAVLVSGKSGVLCYGEITPVSGLYVGAELSVGEKIAHVSPVIPIEKARPDIFGHSRFMLHFEWYTHQVTNSESGSWHHEDPRPKSLRDPTKPLTKSWRKAIYRK